MEDSQKKKVVKAVSLDVREALRPTTRFPVQTLTAASLVPAAGLAAGATLTAAATAAAAPVIVVGLVAVGIVVLVKALKDA